MQFRPTLQILILDWSGDSGYQDGKSQQVVGQGLQLLALLLGLGTQVQTTSFNVGAGGSRLSLNLGGRF